MKATVRARIDEDIRNHATEVLASMGLTVSDAIRMLLTRVARDEAFPFDLTSNALTADTMRKSERGEDLHHSPNIETLFKDLDI